MLAIDPIKPPLTADTSNVSRSIDMLVPSRSIGARGGVFAAWLLPNGIELSGAASHLLMKPSLAQSRPAARRPLQRGVRQRFLMATPLSRRCSPLPSDTYP